MAIEIRCIEHLSSEQRQSLSLLYGPLIGKSSVCLYEFLGSIQNSIDLEDNTIEYNSNKYDYTLLVVEDNGEMRSFLQKELSKYYNVLLAEDGSKALEILQDNIVNLIISDIMMPKMDGWEVLKTVRQYS